MFLRCGNWYLNRIYSFNAVHLVFVRQASNFGQIITTDLVYYYFYLDIKRSHPGNNTITKYSLPEAPKEGVMRDK